MPPFKPFGVMSRAHLKAAVERYSTWWLEAYLAIVVLARLGVFRVLDSAGLRHSAMPMPGVRDGVAFGLVEIVVAVFWAYALVVTLRPFRAIAAFMACGVFTTLAFTWYGFAPAFPNWHGFVGAAGFTFLIGLRHAFQWRYASAPEGAIS